jgi:cation diffusion facilitator CzcD-associated flavoprotein CzcO
MNRTTSTEVLVIGAGPAGLATSRELSIRGVDHLVLERGPRPGHTWEQLYDSLRLHTGKHLSSLPGLGFPREVPLFPSRLDFAHYLQAYAAEFDVPLLAGCEVSGLERAGGGWVARTCSGTLTAQAVVVAAGIVAAPRVPAFPGREEFGGRVMHSVEYRRPAPFRDRRVLVVGVGNSGGEIASELARAGAEVTVAVRSGANVVPLTLLGLPIQYAAYAIRRLPPGARRRVADAVGLLTRLRRGPPVLPRPAHGPLDAIPLIGFHLVDEIRAGRVAVRGGVERFTGEGVRFADGREEPFDDVILATGFVPALGFLDGLVRRDERGHALRTDRVTSADQPGLYFVGHNYDSLGGILNICRDAVLAANAIVVGALR